jgi:hypothetical protein
MATCKIVTVRDPRFGYSASAHATAPDVWWCQTHNMQIISGVCDVGKIEDATDAALLKIQEAVPGVCNGKCSNTHQLGPYCSFCGKRN